MLLEAGENVGWTWNVVLSSYCVAHKLCLCKGAVLICLVKISWLRNLPCELSLARFSVPKTKGSPCPSVSGGGQLLPSWKHSAGQFRQGSLGALPSQGNSALAYFPLPEMLRTDTHTAPALGMLSPRGIWELLSGTRVQLLGSSLKLSSPELSLGPPWSLKAQAKCEA